MCGPTVLRQQYLYSGPPVAHTLEPIRWAELLSVVGLTCKVRLGWPGLTRDAPETWFGHLLAKACWPASPRRAPLQTTSMASAPMQLGRGFRESRNSCAGTSCCDVARKATVPYSRSSLRISGLCNAVLCFQACSRLSCFILRTLGPRPLRSINSAAGGLRRVPATPVPVHFCTSSV